MGRRRSVEDWRRDALASKNPLMTGSVKLLLIYLADHMRPDRKVSVPRRQIADDLGCHEQRVAERFKKAVDAQFLINVTPGRKGVTAVYQGCWPNEDSVPLHSTQTEPQRTDSPDAIRVRESVRYGAVQRTAPLDASSRADLSATTDDQNESSGEEWLDDLVSSLAAPETSTHDCPHGIPNGDEPDPFDEVNPREAICPACRFDVPQPRTKRERKTA